MELGEERTKRISLSRPDFHGPVNPRLTNQGEPCPDRDGAFHGAPSDTGKNPTYCVDVSHTNLPRTSEILQSRYLREITTSTM